MTDIGDTIQAKSDQLNADDLLGGPIVITITRVVVGKKGDDQPVHVHYEGGEGRPWKPSKGMRRALVACWGNQSADYVGRSLRLFRNPEVKWGGEPVGGIQIAAASHIDAPVELCLQVKKGQKSKFRVDVLRADRVQDATVDDARQAITGAADLPALERAWRSKAMSPFRDQLQADMEARKAALSPATTTQDDDGGFDQP
jgi:hypothetical protein